MNLEINKSNVILFPAIPGADISRPPVSGHAGTMGEIERMMRSKLDKLSGSKYPDTFDWSVYDRIARRFPEPPRGGVVFGTTFKLANWHPACSKCHYTFEVDTYGRGCLHNCEYCYAKDQLSSHGYWNRPQPFPVDLAEIRKIFYTVFETDKASKWRSVMERKVPLRIGSMSDSFMWLDLKYGVTKEMLKILRFYKYPHLIFTRSDLVAHDDYIAEMDRTLSAIQFSISGNNTELIKQIEPGAPSFQRRLTAIAKLSGAGFNVGVRINPLFPKYPDGYYSARAQMEERFKGKEIPELPLFNDSFIAEIGSARPSTVIAGVVRLSAKTILYMSRASGVNIREMFLPERWSNGKDVTFSDREVAHYYSWIAAECRKNGLRFSTCYIGNGIKDYFQYQSMWANKADCCDVVGMVSKFKTSSQSIDWKTRTTHASSKETALIAQKQDEGHSGGTLHS